jgi:hypothetical protein
MYDVHCTAMLMLVHPIISGDSPWGLARINQDVSLSNKSNNNDYLYTYNSTAAGAGVDVYILGKVLCCDRHLLPYDIVCRYW